MTIKLIVGLGNPGPSYKKTRHNAGMWLLERISHQYSGVFKLEKKFYGLICDVSINNQICKLLLPNDFMNNSGQAIQAVTHFYKITPEEVLVAHDDLDLLPGAIKFKTGGSHAGHNGLRDTINRLGSQEFHRLRIGIGHPGHRDQVLNYVLGKPSKNDENAIYQAIYEAMQILDDIVASNYQKVMHYLHS